MDGKKLVQNVIYVTINMQQRQMKCKDAKINLLNFTLKKVKPL